ncbi:heptaprenyl diphosphate synthase [Pectinatus cerevisiiphilus]|uniref:Heptaprenyl diphosphate synthase n=2 Tax=Pectinatus cerevisiiphilus TaxID=86956 RepID=A0A4R3K2K4_9FIRM|nr:heptaprenyl diphosphate synthase [Pectinatus cerevisiiphilus]
MLMNKMLYVIKKDLNALEKGLSQQVYSDVALITEISRHLIESGGKRLRPALYFLAAHSHSHYDIDYVLPMAITIELIHMASLVHDDVLDNASIRRGTATANAKWGNNISILSGDFLFSRAFGLVADKDYDRRILMRLSNVICGLSEGEIHQNDKHYKLRSEEEYYTAISKKTADFIAASCEIGGIIAELPKSATDKLYTYGRCLGMAFQITDDILDLTSNDKKIGKPAGNDILQGIITLPVIRAVQTSPDSEELAKIIMDSTLNPQMVKRAVDITRESDGLDYARKKVYDYLDEARQALPDGLPPTIRKSFIEVADFVGKRDF